MYTAPDNLDRVPNAPRTPTHSIRVPDDLWDDLGAVAAANGTDRSKLVVAFMAWYLGRPDADLPERPGEDADS